MSVVELVNTEAFRRGNGAAAAGELLAAVGVPAVEERVYLALLDRPDMTVGMIARAVGLQRDAVGGAVRSLAAKGLVTGQGSPARYQSAAPDVAIEVLVAKKQRELARARLAARLLAQRARRAAEELGDTSQEIGAVETVTGGLAAAQRIWQSHAAAERQVLAFARPSRADDNPVELVSLRPGVAHRMVRSRLTLESPGMREYVAVGGQFRIAEVPIEMMIVDRELALLPVHANGELARVLLVRAGPMVDALVEYFEVVWEHATPLAFDSDGDVMPTGGNGKGAAEMANLVSLLVAGCKDEAIARRLGVSTRTLDRRVQTLMRGLNAVTRFQAGWMAAKRHGHM